MPYRTGCLALKVPEKTVAEITNSADLDEVAHDEPPHLGVQCFPFNLDKSVSVCVLCVPPYGFVWAITSAFMHGFQNNVAQLLSFRSSSAI